MKKLSLLAIGMTLILCWALESQAGKFDPLFKIEAINGTCNVGAAGSETLEAAVEGKAYPYGTRVKTDRNSSCIIKFSTGNECMVMANADLILTEGTQDKKIKNIKLNQGKIDVTLEHDYNKNNELNVETTAAICGAISCKFTVDARTEDDLNLTIIGCAEGKIKLTGRNFGIMELDADDWITVASSLERDFIRIKNVKGLFQVIIKNDQGQEETIDLKPAGTLKIWTRRTEEGNIVVTIMVLKPDGNAEKTYTYSDKDTRTQEEIKKEEENIATDKTNATDQTKPKEDDVLTTTTTTIPVPTTTTTFGGNLITGTTSTQSGTTTEESKERGTPTTSPSTTPVGRR